MENEKPIWIKRLEKALAEGRIPEGLEAEVKAIL